MRIMVHNNHAPFSYICSYYYRLIIIHCLHFSGSIDKNKDRAWESLTAKKCEIKTFDFDYINETKMLNELE